jgi:hypothetical protein
MKSLIIAALLVTASPAFSAPVAKSEPTEQQIEAYTLVREQDCINIMTGKSTAKDVIAHERLDTPQKRLDFITSCIMLSDGLQAGAESHNAGNTNAS